MLFKRLILSAIFLFSVQISLAQFLSAEIGVYGLTCSACTRSVEMSIRKLDFVKDVQMDLMNTNGKIFFKDSAQVSIEKIAKAVENAGFSVSYLHADFHFQSLAVFDNFCYSYRGDTYQFLKVGSKTLNGNITLNFLGKDFIPQKELKKWTDLLKPICPVFKQEIYFVTL